MVTLYTSGKQVEITYANGDVVPFDYIIGIAYRPGWLLIIWADRTMKEVDDPADIYKRISCPLMFDIDIKLGA